MIEKDIEIMINEELDDFYTDKTESDKRFKLLLEFANSKYKYNSTEFNIPKNSKKKVIKAKEIDLSKIKQKGNKLF